MTGRDRVAGERALVEEFRAAGEGHVFRFLDDLDPPGRHRLFSSARAIDLKGLARIRDGHGMAPPTPEPEPLGPERVGRDELAGDAPRAAAARALGEEWLRRGKVALVTLAGGQGTRLGWKGPKGCFPIGPGEHTLFDYHAEAVSRATERAGCPIPWVILVSAATEAATLAYIHRRGLRDVHPATVRLCRQGVLPSLDDDGHLILERKDRIAVAPDGHGGLLRALRDSGTMAWLANLGVEELSCFQVDNPLVPPADPLFLGLHGAATGQMSTKVFPKAHPAEKVGVVVRLEGRPGVIEYTELSPERAAMVDDRGRLAFGDANMAAHVVSLPFLAAVAWQGLPLHRVRKVVPFVDDAGVTVRPAEPNAWKYECFLFDALRHAARGVVLEVAREEEFAPVKNAEGEDSPETARALLERAGRLLP